MIEKHWSDITAMIKLRWYNCDGKIAMLPLRCSYLSPNPRFHLVMIQITFHPFIFHSSNYLFRVISWLPYMCANKLVRLWLTNSDFWTEVQNKNNRSNRFLDKKILWKFECGLIWLVASCRSPASPCRVRSTSLTCFTLNVTESNSSQVITFKVFNLLKLFSALISINVFVQCLFTYRNTRKVT